MSRAYYNEFDPKAAAWLRELIADGQIAPGDVDERDIRDVAPGDLRGYTQCHFFAGIGGWSLALRLAGWPDDRPVWTGSAPCQPFSEAGRQLGFADERHLWPALHYLTGVLQPPVFFGEQVAAATRHGWIDLVQEDMEGAGYACGAISVPAAGVGAPHIRDRLWIVAERLEYQSGLGRDERWAESGGRRSTGGCSPHRLDNSECARLEGHGCGHCPACRHGEGSFRSATPAGESDWLADEHVHGCASVSGGHLHDEEHHPQPRCGSDELVDGGRPGPTNGFWRDADWLFCRDGKWRPAQPGTQPLAPRLPRGVVPSGDPSASEVRSTQEARVMRLKGYGNAIVPQVAAEVIKAYTNADLFLNHKENNHE